MPTHPPEVVCDGEAFTLYPTASGWSAFNIVGTSTHFVTTAFEVTAFDVETGQVYGHVYEQKGNGNANHNQDTVVCTFSKIVLVEGPPANGRWVESRSLVGRWPSREPRRTGIAPKLKLRQVADVCPRAFPHAGSRMSPRRRQRS